MRPSLALVPVIVCTDNRQGVVQSLRTVHSSMGTTWGSTLMLTITENSRTECTATWVAKAPPPSYVADQPCLICTILPGHIPSEPLSCKRPGGGPLEAATGTSRPLSISTLSVSIDFLESDLVSSRTLERRVDVVGSMTVELCIPACQAESFTIAGLEYAQECCRSINHPGIVGAD